MPALGLAPLAIICVAFVIFSIYWMFLTTGQHDIGVGPFSFGLDNITGYFQDAIQAATIDVVETLFPESLAFIFVEAFSRLDVGQSVYSVSIWTAIQIFTYTEDTTKAGIRDVINWAYGRDINNVTATTATQLETLLGTAHNVANTLDMYTYFFGTVDMQIANIYSALSTIGQQTIPMIYTLLTALAATEENTIGGLLGLEGVIVPGIQTEVVNLQGVVAFINGLIALDQPLIEGWVTDIPDIKGRVATLEQEIEGVIGAIPLTPEMVAELAALAALAGLSTVAIETLVNLAENPCGIVELCNIGGGGDSMVEAAVLALLLDTV